MSVWDEESAYNELIFIMAFEDNHKSVSAWKKKWLSRIDSDRLLRIFYLADDRVNPPSTARKERQRKQ